MWKELQMKGNSPPSNEARTEPQGDQSNLSNVRTVSSIEAETEGNRNKVPAHSRDKKDLMDDGRSKSPHSMAQVRLLLFHCMTFLLPSLLFIYSSDSLATLLTSVSGPFHLTILLTSLPSIPSLTYLTAHHTHQAVCLSFIPPSISASVLGPQAVLPSPSKADPCIHLIRTLSSSLASQQAVFLSIHLSLHPYVTLLLVYNLLSAFFSISRKVLRPFVSCYKLVTILLPPAVKPHPGKPKRKKKLEAKPKTK